MRKVLAIALLLLVASFDGPGFAAATLATVSGKAVDAAGQGLGNQRVDLVRDGQVVSVATADARGEWSFRNVNDGNYIVRTNTKGKIAGVRVSVVDGRAVTGTLIVVPTAAVSPQFGALAGLVGSLTTSLGTVAASTLSTVVNKTEATNLNADDVVAILNALPADKKVEFAQAVIAAVSQPDVAGSGNVFVQPSTTGTTANTSGTTGAALNQALVNAFTQIVNNPTAPVPTVVLGAS